MTPPLLHCRALTSSAAFLVALSAFPVAAQSEGEVGLAIAQVCGEVDVRSEGVLAGTVRDASSGVVLDRATVVLKWQIPGDEYPGTAAERTNTMEGLVRRMNSGFGDFMLRTDIEAKAATSLPELLVGMPGVRLLGRGDSLVIRGRTCLPMLFMDGRLTRLDPDRGLLDVNLFDVEAVEFYKGTASIPAEFNYSTNTQAGCGAVVVWTRRGR